MPKFPGLSGKEIVRALEKLGFRVARQSGSHILMKKAKKAALYRTTKKSKLVL